MGLSNKSQKIIFIIKICKTLFLIGNLNRKMMSHPTLTFLAYSLRENSCHFRIIFE